jgi:stage III sporulation protein AD
MEVFRIVVIGIVCAILTVVVRQYRPDIAPFIQMAGIIVMSALIIGFLKDILTSVNGLFSTADVINDGYLTLLTKVLGIAIVTKIGSDICSDSGNAALATNVELAGKVLILMLCMSLLKTIASLASGLLR